MRMVFYFHWLLSGINARDAASLVLGAKGFEPSRCFGIDNLYRFPGRCMGHEASIFIAIIT